MCEGVQLLGICRIVVVDATAPEVALDQYFDVPSGNYTEVALAPFKRPKKVRIGSQVCVDNFPAQEHNLHVYYSIAAEAILESEAPKSSYILRNNISK